MKRVFDFETPVFGLDSGVIASFIVDSEGLVLRPEAPVPVPLGFSLQDSESFQFSSLADVEVNCTGGSRVVAIRSIDEYGTTFRFGRLEHRPALRHPWSVEWEAHGRVKWDLCIDLWLGAPQERGEAPSPGADQAHFCSFSNLKNFSDAVRFAGVLGAWLNPETLDFKEAWEPIRRPEQIDGKWRARWVELQERRAKHPWDW